MRPCDQNAPCFNYYATRWIPNTFQVSSLFFSRQTLYIGQGIVACHKNFEHDNWDARQIRKKVLRLVVFLSL